MPDFDLPKPYYPFPLAKKPKNIRRQYHEKSRHERGYDNDWVKLRNNHIAKNPLCAHHLKRRQVVEAKDVDHIIPFKSLDDPLRLDPDNLESLCRKCHRIKTARQ